MKNEKIFELYKNILPILLDKYSTNKKVKHIDSIKDSLHIAELAYEYYITK